MFFVAHLGVDCILFEQWINLGCRYRVPSERGGESYFQLQHPDNAKAPLLIHPFPIEFVRLIVVRVSFHYLTFYFNQGFKTSTHAAIRSSVSSGSVSSSRGRPTN